MAGEGIKHNILDSVGTANVRVKAQTDNVAGVKLPKFEHYLEGGAGRGGAGRGGSDTPANETNERMNEHINVNTINQAASSLGRAHERTNRTNERTCTGYYGRT